MKRFFPAWAAAAVLAAATAAALEPRTWSFDAPPDAAISEQDGMSWVQGESVALEYAVPEALADGQFALWEVTQGTNLYIRAEAEDAGASLRWLLSPDETTLAPGRYAGRVAVYSTDGGTTTFHRVLAQQGVRVYKGIADFGKLEPLPWYDRSGLDALEGAVETNAQGISSNAAAIAALEAKTNAFTEATRQSNGEWSVDESVVFEELVDFEDDVVLNGSTTAADLRADVFRMGDGARTNLWQTEAEILAAVDDWLWARGVHLDHPQYGIASLNGYGNGFSFEEGQWTNPWNDDFRMINTNGGTWNFQTQRRPGWNGAGLATTNDLKAAVDSMYDSAADMANDVADDLARATDMLAGAITSNSPALSAITNAFGNRVSEFETVHLGWYLTNEATATIEPHYLDPTTIPTRNLELWVNASGYTSTSTPCKIYVANTNSYPYPSRPTTITIVCYSSNANSKVDVGLGGGLGAQWQPRSAFRKMVFSYVPETARWSMQTFALTYNPLYRTAKSGSTIPTNHPQTIDAWIEWRKQQPW